MNTLSSFNPTNCRSTFCPTVLTRYEYFRDDLLHKMILERPSQPHRVFTYSYDAAGRLDEIVFPSSTGVKAIFRNAANAPGSGFDENDNLLFLRYEKNGGLIRRFEWSYDDSNNRQSQLDVTPAKATKWEYGYDWLDRLETVKKAEASTVAALGSLQLVSVYSYDASHNRTEFQVPNLNEVYSYTFDDADNILTQTKTTNSVTNFIESFTHDDDGNLLTRTRSDTGETITYQWNDFDRLLRVSSSTTGRKQDNRFDVNGLRNRKLDKNGNSSLEYDIGISTTSSRPGSANSAAPIISYLGGLGAEVNGVFQYWLGDSIGSVRDIINETGNVVASYEFSEYGQKISPANANGVESAKTWIGGLSVNDDTGDSGLYLMGHRFYDASLGRFLNRDPIGFAGGLNLFEYAGSSPVTFKDHTGLQPHTLTSPSYPNGVYSFAIEGTPIINTGLETGSQPHYEFRIRITNKSRGAANFSIGFDQSSSRLISKHRMHQDLLLLQGEDRAAGKPNCNNPSLTIPAGGSDSRLVRIPLAISTEDVHGTYWDFSNNFHIDYSGTEPTLKASFPFFLNEYSGSHPLHLKQQILVDRMGGQQSTGLSTGAYNAPGTR